MNTRVTGDSTTLSKKLILAGLKGGHPPRWEW